MLSTKYGDAKSQAFDNWTKEFFVNVFMQSFHAMAYVLIMSIIAALSQDPSENWLLILIALSFVSKGDDILKNIFALSGRADTVKGLASTLGQVTAISAVTGGINAAKKKLGGKDSRLAKLSSTLSQKTQKAWDKADNRVNAAAADIRMKELEAIMDKNALDESAKNELTEDEMKKDIQNSLNTLLGKNGAVSDEEFRKAADKLTGYMNQENNEQVQKMIDDMAASLSDEERQALDNILAANASINAMMVGGRDVNIKQNIDIIISCLKRDANGKLTPQSLALLNKIAASEADLEAMKVIGNVKFKKKNIMEMQDRQRNAQNRVYNNAYFKDRDARNRSAKGRGAASENKANNKDAKSQLEVMMNGAGSNLTKYSSKNTRAARNAKRTSSRANMPGRERAKSSNQVRSAMKGNSTNNPYVRSRYPKFKGLKKPQKPWQNVDSVTGSQGLETAKFGASAKYKVSKKPKQEFVKTSRAEKIKDPVDRIIKYVPGRKDSDTTKKTGTTSDYGVPEKKSLKTAPNTGTTTVREMKKRKEEAREELSKQNDNSKNRKSSYSQTSGAFTIKRNREEARKKQKEDKDSTINMPSTNQMSENRASAGRAQNPGAEFANRQGSADNLTQILNKEQKRDISQDRKFVENATKKLNDAASGDYSAAELLAMAKNLSKISSVYQNGTEEEKKLVEEIKEKIGCKPEDYEAYIRVKILNDPDSVGNNRKIIEECKAYLWNNDVPAPILDKLGYSLDELKEGVDPKLLRKRNTDDEGIVSREERSRVQEEYNNRMEYNRLSKEKAKLDRKNEKEYGTKAIIKDTAEVLKDATLFVADTAINVGNVGIGAITTGMTVNGKQDQLGQAVTGMFGGYQAADKITGNAIEYVKGTIDEVKEIMPKKEKKKDGPIISKQLSAEDMQAKIENLRDKTTIKTKSFTYRGKK